MPSGFTRDDMVTALEELGNALEEVAAGEEELKNQSEWLSRAVEEAERERQRYQELFEFAPDGYLVTDRYAIILEANMAAFAMLDVTSDTFIRKPLAVFFSGLEKRRFMSLLGEIKASLEPASTVIEVRSRQGNALTVYLKGAATRGSGGEVTSIRWLMRDYSERKLVEDRLASVNEKLNEYTSTVSHDLKGPVSTILLGIRFLREDLQACEPGYDSDDVVETLEAIEKNAMRSYELIAGLLQRARSEKASRVDSSVDLNEVVGRIVEDIRVLRRDTKVRFDVESDLGTVNMSELEVYQVFVNLIENAIQHGNSEMPEVSIKRVGGPSEDRFMVRDNGMGFPKSMIDSTPDGGLGLGLSIVNRIVTDDGGWIRLSNDGGAVVEVLLHRQGDQPAEQERDAGPFNVLVVEDEPGTAFLISRLLKKNFEVETEFAEDLETAERMLAAKDFDLVTLDYILPDGKGIDLLEEMLENPAKPPVIVVTGHGDEKLAASFFELGAAGYVIKDADMLETLRRAVDRAIKDRGAEQPNSRIASP